jgi:hypothetical protein
VTAATTPETPPPAERAKSVRKSPSTAAQGAVPKVAVPKSAATKRAGEVLAEVAPTQAKPVRRAKASPSVVEAELVPTKPAAKRSRAKA